MCDPYRELWWAVLERAILDALMPAKRQTGNASPNTADSHDARRWLRYGRDFPRVCALAGADPDFIRDRIEPLLDDDDAAERFVGAMRGKGWAEPTHRGFIGRVA